MGTSEPAHSSLLAVLLWVLVCALLAAALVVAAVISRPLPALASPSLAEFLRACPKEVVCAKCEASGASRVLVRIVRRGELLRREALQGSCICEAKTSERNTSSCELCRIVRYIVLGAIHPHKSWAHSGLSGKLAPSKEL